MLVFTVMDCAIELKTDTIFTQNGINDARMNENIGKIVKFH